VNESGQWVCWDFGQFRVRLTNYTIQSRYLKSWTLEWSQDAKTWEPLDRRTDSLDFKGSNTVSFAISGSLTCRFIRLIQTGPNHYGHNILRLHAFEVFGKLMSPVACPTTDAKSFNGIIHHRAEKHRETALGRRLVEVNASSIDDENPGVALENVLDFSQVLNNESNLYFKAHKGKEEWIRWDFGDCLVRVSHYTIQSPSLRSWILWGSMRDAAPTELDRQVDNQDLGDLRAVAQFPVSDRGTSIESRFLWLMVTDETNMSAGRVCRAPVLTLNAVEFFGMIFE
jgi:hypothetical protein